MSEQTPGVILEQAPADWQILQRDSSGFAAVALAGRWQEENPPPGPLVEARVVREDSAQLAAGDTDWRPMQTEPNGTWSGMLRVPAGGLYRLETRLNNRTGPRNEWSMRGDMRHFWGVGDLWVIAGQSNSAGYGRGPVHDPPELGVHLLGHNMRWALASHPLNDSTDSRHPANREAANPAHSPYLRFAKDLQAALGCPIGLIQTALGGSGMDAWRPVQGGNAPLYDNMLTCVRQAGGKVRGLLWYQGESDANDQLAPPYAEKFAQMIDALRSALDQPDLPALTVQLGRYLDGTPEAARGWSLLREQQRAISRNLRHAYVVPALDLPLSDAIHIAPSGNLILGKRLAQLARQKIFGQAVVGQAPDVQKAVLSADRRSVELSFAPVTSHIGSIVANNTALIVEDEQGNVPVSKVVFGIAPDKINLELAQPLAGGGKVHCGMGCDPPILPIDFERQLPILAFYDVPVEEKIA